MTLIERVHSLRSRAEKHGARQVGLEEVRKLEPLLEQARNMSDSLSREVQQLRLLRDQGLALPEPPEASGQALKALGRLRERFAQERRAQRLTRGRDWTLFKQRTEAACEQAAEGLNKSWRDFVASAYSGDKPESLETSLAPTEVNRACLSRYRDAYRRVAGLARKRPESPEDFEQVRALARQLNEIHQGFDFDVPDVVSDFLRAVAAGGASIDLLTDEVRAWLERQGKSGSYHIVAGASAT